MPRYDALDYEDDRLGLFKFNSLSHSFEAQVLGSDQESWYSNLPYPAITIDFDGNFEFWFNDGDLFWGHGIMVSGNLEKGPMDAGIHG